MPKYGHGCGVTKVGNINLGAGVHKLDHYLFRKMRKSQEQDPFYNQILHNFNIIFFSMIDIKKMH